MIIMIMIMMMTTVTAEMRFFHCQTAREHHGALRQCQ